VLKRVEAFFPLVLVMALAGCPGGSDTVGTSMPSAPHPAVGLRLQTVVSMGLSFPVFATAPADGSNRLFIVEKNGVIKILDFSTGLLLPTPFLTVTNIDPAGEQGLLGLAFHPNYGVNGFFYVNVVTPAGFTEIRRYQVSMGNPNQANPASSTVMISIDQRLPNNGGLFTNHKAGWLGFGPDGLLYAALGDGGSGGDPQNVAQNPNILLGKMLRLDVDGFPNVIPPGNPFVGISGADEIWSLGLRNPWRASFDRGTGDLYIADVGQGAREEVNVSTAASGGGKGVNYGWKIMEGTLCFSPPCNVPGLTPPVEEYDHSGGACSITGGYVYRGNVIPALQGTYFYADYCLGFVRSFRFVNGMATERSDWPALDPNENITSFGEDQAGELYIVTQQGRLYRIMPN
jgi:hypothetical protein